MATKTAALPIPGLVFGSYPENPNKSSEILPRFARSLKARLEHPSFARLGRYRAFVASVRKLERTFKAISATELSSRVVELRARLGRDSFNEVLMAEVCAAVAVVCARELEAKLYDTQLIAARIMLDNRLAEMATGEGKTLGAAVTAATAALAGIPVHVLTTNDYLVARDAKMLQPLYSALGLTVGTVIQGMDAPARRATYGKDITYCTAKELVFDYLRDRLARQRARGELQWRAARITGASAPQTFLRGLCMGIIDEADSILIDEARIPLILSRAADNGEQIAYLQRAMNLTAALTAGKDFQLDPVQRTATLTESGRECVRVQAAPLGNAWHNRKHREETVNLALSALHLFQRDRDYLVRDGQVLIIDETTGRLAEGRAWSRGLHQLIEIKEGCRPTCEAEPLAQITYQRFFPRYLRLSGMSGTLSESRGELFSVYGLEVVRVPLRRPSRRTVIPTRVFTGCDAQWRAVVERVRECHLSGRPVLIGTDSVADSESLSQRLSATGLPHAVLNARLDRPEAQIVATAGELGRVTVATNMAGRGTDIPLGPGVAELGGLHVIACQQNAARRIDRQLMGRCARQGDPGGAERLLSLDGPLVEGSFLSTLGRLLARGEEVWPRGLGVFVTWFAQHTAERRQRREREELVRHDAEMDRWLAFGGLGE